MTDKYNPNNNTQELLQEDINKVINKEPQLIPANHLRSEDAFSYVLLEQQIGSFSTDLKTFEAIKSDWQEVLKVFKDDPELVAFKLKYETVFNAFQESYTNEQKLVKKCKETGHDLAAVMNTTNANQKYTADYAESISILKQEIKNNFSMITKTKKKEDELRQKIKASQAEIQEINQKRDTRIEKIQAECEHTVQEQTEQRNDLTRKRDKILTKLSECRTRSEYGMKQLKGQEEENIKHVTDISNTKEEVMSLHLIVAKEEARKKGLEAQMEVTKKEIDEANEEKDKKAANIKENIKKIETMKENVLNKAKEKEKLHENVHTKNAQKNATEKEKEKHAGHLRVLTQTNGDQHEEYTKLTHDINLLKVDLERAVKEHEIYSHKRLHVLKDRKELEQKKAWLEQQLDEEQKAFEERKKALLIVEESLQSVFRNKEEINRDIRKGEEEEHEVDDELAELNNSLKNLENHIRGYQIEANKLNRIINILEKEQEKYGIDASQAHAKYYQTLEELKIKNNLIQELQKKNTELDAKLKHQQNLYEAVRSDRNLYSKNLLQAHEEIGSLTKKYTRMSHEVDNLKDELKVKDMDLVKQDRAVQKIIRENEKNKIEKGRVEKNIVNIETVLKDQEQQIDKLKYIIGEAQVEKTRQHKDYEMVVSERDILGGQLIKRNQELTVLYEKIKISQSSLLKGETFYREKQREFAENQKGLMTLRKELDSTQEQSESIDDLKREANQLRKDIIKQKTTVKSLQDELEVPMNIHRWRKMEATDKDNYERILRIQALQRMLVAKTEECNDKDKLIKDKEALYLELKNILARQPGSEVHQELVTYKETIKEKSGQMKKMLNELKEAQNNVKMGKFEVERLRGEIAKMKKEYYKKRSDEDKAKSTAANTFAHIGQNVTVPMAYRANLGMLGASADMSIGGMMSKLQKAA